MYSLHFSKNLHIFFEKFCESIFVQNTQVGLHAANFVQPTEIELSGLHGRLISLILHER